MSKEIKRYRIDTVGHPYAQKDGMWVKASDHLATLEAVKATVKPLEWTKPPVSDTLRRADSILGVYRVWSHGEAGGKWFWCLEASVTCDGTVNSEEEGKASAQSHHDRRILSALAANQRQAEDEA